MDPSYESVVEFGDLFWTLVAYQLHGAIIFFQASLACFLLATGAHGLLFPQKDGRWLRKLGVSHIGADDARPFGAARIGLGLLLLTPFAFGAPSIFSLGAAIGAFALLLLWELRMPAGEKAVGRLVRRAAIAFAGVAAAFMVWEGEDNLSLGADLLMHALEWRGEELDWQLSQDPRSPKVGDLAPDFELQDPEGTVQVRLSEFRGKRPVALIFGSYT